MDEIIRAEIDRYLELVDSALRVAHERGTGLAVRQCRPDPNTSFQTFRIAYEFECTNDPRSAGMFCSYEDICAALDLLKERRLKL